MKIVFGSLSRAELSTQVRDPGDSQESAAIGPVPGGKYQLQQLL
jgi:hypothetical protein